MLDKNRFFVDPDIAKAESLPPEAFTSKEFLELEIEKIFKRFWLFAPVEIPRGKNKWAPFDILERKLFLAADEAETLRVFPNACTHKWSGLIREKGSGTKIICPYHGRQFDLGGKFIFQPRCGALEYFPRAEDNLKNLRSDRRYNFLFVNFDGPVVSLGEIFNPISRFLFYSPIEDAVPCGPEKIKIDGNWKSHIDNYVDESHLLFVHQDLVRETEIASYETKLYKFTSARWVYAKDPEDGFGLPGFSKPIFGFWWHIFPNITINVWKGGISVNSYEPDLEDPGKTNLIICNYIWNKKEFEKIRKKWAKMTVDKEDLDVVGGVHGVIKHTPAPRGRFTPDGERACHWFQHLVHESIFEK